MCKSKKSLKTPRGIINFGFKTMEDAKKAGFGYYFEHDGYTIVGNGTQAFAIECRNNLDDNL